MRYIIILSIIFFILPSSTPIIAYNCPFGYVNDPYPGLCALYIDQNNDNICDNSQNILNTTKIDRDEISNSKTNYYIWQITLIFIIFQLIGISLIQYNKLNKIQWRKINNYALLASFIVVVFTSLILLSGVIPFRQLGGQAINLRIVKWLHVESGLIMIFFSVEHIIKHWRCFLR